MDGFSSVFEEKLPADFVMQQHRPEPMDRAHIHGHVEILLPIDCRLTYQTQMGTYIAPDRRISVLWGQIPHRVSTVEYGTLKPGETGDETGEILIANLPLSELLSWSMPEFFLAELFAGSLIVANASDPLDQGQFARWYDDYTAQDSNLVAVARMEMQLRLRRQTLIGWHSETDGTQPQGKTSTQSLRVQKMIRFMAENYRSSLSVKVIASHAGVSEGHAMGLFQKMVNTSINGYLTKLRLHHARTALCHGDDKIVNIALDSGFGSLSRFYEVFVAETGLTPKEFRQQRSNL